MIYQIKKYSSYLFNSKTKYKVHSPFVFELITECFTKEIPLKKTKKFKSYKAFLKKNDSLISVTDFGAGSRVFKSNNRKISAIAKNAGISNKNAFRLMQLANFFKSKQILEIGTSLGLGTLALALGNSKSIITTLEGCNETLKTPKNQLKNYIDNTIQFVVGDFNKTLKKATNNATYDLIYFDGNHAKKPTIAYFEMCLKTVHNDTVFIFDDIHWSKEMTAAWEYIKQHEQVTLTIDTFYWGLVFFRKEQFEKEHFIIRH